MRMLLGMETSLRRADGEETMCGEKEEGKLRRDKRKKGEEGDKKRRQMREKIGKEGE
jgi:hypothetical protein